MSPSADRPKLRCQLEPAGAPILVGETFAYVIHNTGATPLMYGADDAIEWRTSRGWRRLPLGGWLAAVGMILEPGQRSDPRLVEVTSYLAPGRYRLTKKVSRGDMPQADSITVSCDSRSRCSAKDDLSRGFLRQAHSLSDAQDGALSISTSSTTDRIVPRSRARSSAASAAAVATPRRVLASPVRSS